MTSLPDKFVADRDLRNSARAVFLMDLAHARQSLSGKGIADRVTGQLADRVSEGAKDVFAVAKAGASANRSTIAVLLGAIILWFAHAPILELLGIRSSEAEDEAEGASAHEHEAMPSKASEGDPPDRPAEPAAPPRTTHSHPSPGETHV